MFLDNFNSKEVLFYQAKDFPILVSPHLQGIQSVYEAQQPRLRPGINLRNLFCAFASEKKLKKFFRARWHFDPRLMRKGYARKARYGQGKGGEAGHRKVKSAGDNALAVNRNLWRARQFNACDFR